jgi:hypothetical protein
MDKRKMKIALQIKRKKAGKLINGNVNIPATEGNNFRHKKFADGHSTKGGSHRQVGGPDNIYSK